MSVDLSKLPPGSTVDFGIEERPITEHPEFHRARYDWGIRHAYTTEAWTDAVTGEEHPAVEVPEDRSGYRPDWNGKALADFWDSSRGMFVDGPLCYRGIMGYLAPVTKITPPPWKPYDFSASEAFELLSVAVQGAGKSLLALSAVLRGTILADPKKQRALRNALRAKKNRRRRYWLNQFARKGGAK